MEDHTSTEETPASKKPRRSPLKGKTFILGAGAQKCGTTWLFSYLNSHPELEMTNRKELHVFDAMFAPQFYSRYTTEAAKALLDAIAQNAQSGAIPLNGQVRRARAMLNAHVDIAEYPNIFRTISRKAKATGDITPSYASIDARGFRQIRQMLRGEGATVRVVFLMRDPVERFYSAARMFARERANTDVESINRIFLRFLRQDAHLTRGRYDQTVAALNKAFKPEELYFGFYETLFNQAEIEKLCNFLGIAHVPADFDSRFNTTVRQGDLPTEVFKEGRAILDPVYSFCRERFGDQVPESWHP